MGLCAETLGFFPGRLRQLQGNVSVLWERLPGRGWGGVKASEDY